MVISCDFHSYVSLPEGSTGRDTLGETWLFRCQHLLIVQQTNEGILRYVTTNIWDFTDPASKKDLLNQPANMMDCCLWMEILPTTMILYIYIFNSISHYGDFTSKKGMTQAHILTTPPTSGNWDMHIHIYIYIYLHTHTHTLPELNAVRSLVHENVLQIDQFPKQVIYQVDVS